MAGTGERAKAREIFDELRAQRSYVPAYDLALVCVGLSWTDQAFEWFDKARVERCCWLTYLAVGPRLDGLRGDARFSALLRQVGLSPPSDSNARIALKSINVHSDGHPNKTVRTGRPFRVARALLTTSAVIGSLK